MSAVMYGIALASTVALLVVTAYFLMGSVPLLVLKHDTPLDARFVRGFFHIYFVADAVAATVTAISFALAGRLAIAAGAAVLALIAVSQRRRVIPRMDALGTQIQASDLQAIPGFRRLHLLAILMNVLQLVAIVWCLVGLGRAQMAQPAASAASCCVARS